MISRAAVSAFCWTVAKARLNSLACVSKRWDICSARPRYASRSAFHCSAISRGNSCSKESLIVSICFRATSCTSLTLERRASSIELSACPIISFSCLRYRMLSLGCGLVRQGRVSWEGNYKTNSAMSHPFKGIAIFGWFKLGSKDPDQPGWRVNPHDHGRDWVFCRRYRGADSNGCVSDHKWLYLANRASGGRCRSLGAHYHLG